MKLRNLRIAWSVACGLAALLLSILWIRSYRYFDDELKYIDSSGRGWYIDSLEGGLVFVTSPHDPTDPGKWRGYGAWEPGPLGFEKFTTLTTPRSYSFRIPYWFAAVASIFSASAPWCIKRFSLRTVLVTTTVIAIGLTLIAWLG